jgi:hypothetical protein
MGTAAILDGWPSLLRLIPVTSRTSNGTSLGAFCPSRCAAETVVIHVESATPHEVTLVHATLAKRFVSQLPVRLIGDNAYESPDWMRNWRAVAWN